MVIETDWKHRASSCMQCCESTAIRGQQSLGAFHVYDSIQAGWNSLVPFMCMTLFKFLSAFHVYDSIQAGWNSLVPFMCMTLFKQAGIP